MKRSLSPVCMGSAQQRRSHDWFDSPRAKFARPPAERVSSDNGLAVPSSGTTRTTKRSFAKCIKPERVQVQWSGCAAPSAPHKSSVKTVTQAHRLHALSPAGPGLFATLCYLCGVRNMTSGFVYTAFRHNQIVCHFLEPFICTASHLQLQI